MRETITEESVLRLFTTRWLDEHYPRSSAHSQVRYAVEQYALVIMAHLGVGEDKAPPTPKACIKAICQEEGLGIDDRGDKLVIFL